MPGEECVAALTPAGWGEPNPFDVMRRTERSRQQSRSGAGRRWRSALLRQCRTFALAFNYGIAV